MLLVALLTVGGGFIVGMTGVQGQRWMNAIAASNDLFGAVAFTIAGCLTPADRVQHLAVVALISWMVGPAEAGDHRA